MVGDQEDEGEDYEGHEGISSLMLVAQKEGDEGTTTTDAAVSSEGLPHDRYYHFQGLYVPAVTKSVSHFEPRRGIVITASGRIPGQAIGAYVTVYILRKVLGCQLPIEIYFVGVREMFETSLQAKLRELGDVQVMCRCVCVCVCICACVRVCV